MDSNLQAKIQEFFQRATPEVQELLLSDEVNKASAVLGKLYALPISKYVPLKNIITFLLLGIIEPKDAVEELQKDLEVDAEVATKIAQDMDKTILQKARVALMGEEVGEVKVLKIAGKDEETNKEELRKVILDTTKRESAIEKSPVKEGERRAKKILVKGSHSELVEQLNLLGSIPDDEEIRARLENIKSQMKVVVEEEPPKPVPKELENLLSGGGQKIVPPKARVATYSVAPTSYNIDPYRETPA
ncbi:MAG: hypothetical protein QG653_600 [Patescibacteria group bacterium]|nr:hypothetical protein [Patescibacteria group bacterium]